MLVSSSHICVDLILLFEVLLIIFYFFVCVCVCVYLFVWIKVISKGMGHLDYKHREEYHQGPVFQK